MPELIPVLEKGKIDTIVADLGRKISTEYRNRESILIKEDVFDTGITLDYLVEYLRSVDSRCINVCTLLNKKERLKINSKIDYTDPEVEEGFLVRYGLTVDGYNRNQPGIYHMKFLTGAH